MLLRPLVKLGDSSGGGAQAPKRDPWKVTPHVSIGSEQLTTTFHTK